MLCDDAVIVLRKVDHLKLGGNYVLFPVDKQEDRVLVDVSRWRRVGKGGKREAK